MHNTRYDHCPRLPEDGPIDLDGVVAGTGDILLEIGPGRGMFALQCAALYPGRRIVALEIRRKLATLLDERFAKKHISNARCFAEDAGAVLPRLGPDGCVRDVAVCFPDPWWKKRHEKRVVLKDDFVAGIARLVARGGTVFVQTDVESRAEEYLARLSACDDFENAAPRGRSYVDESPFAPARSNREALAIAYQLPVWRLLFRRR